MGYFDEQMVAIKLGDLDNIPCSTRRVSGGRRIIPRTYPNRDGQATEDMGREPYKFELEIPLFKGVSDFSSTEIDHYPTMADQLRFLLESPPAQLEYRDHEFGTMHVSVGPWTSNLDAQKRDGVIFHVELTEDDLDIAGTFRETTAPADVASAGDALDQQLAETDVQEPNVVKALNKKGLGLSGAESSFAAGAMWATQAVLILEQIQAGIVTAVQAGAIADTTRGRIDVLLALPELQSPTGASARAQAILFVESVTQLVERISRTGIVEVEELIADRTTAFEVAARLYGDEQRAAEIMERNPLIDPLFIPRGTRLVVASS